jgi:hypothetical protein
MFPQMKHQKVQQYRNAPPMSSRIEKIANTPFLNSFIYDDQPAAMVDIGLSSSSNQHIPPPKFKKTPAPPSSTVIIFEYECDKCESVSNRNRGEVLATATAAEPGNADTAQAASSLLLLQPPATSRQAHHQINIPNSKLFSNSSSSAMTITKSVLPMSMLHSDDRSFPVSNRKKEGGGVMKKNEENNKERLQGDQNDVENKEDADREGNNDVHCPRDNKGRQSLAADAAACCINNKSIHQTPMVSKQDKIDHVDSLLLNNLRQENEQLKSSIETLEMFFHSCLPVLSSTTKDIIEVGVLGRVHNMTFQKLFSFSLPSFFHHFFFVITSCFFCF